MNKWWKREFSLKAGLIAIMVICWLVPVAIVLGAMDYYSSVQAGKQLQRTIIDSVESGVELTNSGLANTMDLMRAITFEANIRNAKNRYAIFDDKTRFYESVTQSLRSQFSANSTFMTSMIYLTSEPDTIYYIGNHLNTNALERANIYQEMVHPTIQAIQNYLQDEIRFLVYDDTLYMVRALYDNTSDEPYAVLVIEVNSPHLFRGLNSVMWLTAARVRINNVQINTKGIGVKMPKHAEVVEGMFYAEDGDVVRVESRQSVGSYSVAYVMAIDTEPLWKWFDTFKRMTIVIVLMIIPLLGVAIWVFYRHISLPVESMVEAAERIQEGQLGYQIENMPKSRELHYLAENFNSMSRNTKEQFERSYYEQVALQNERIKALQSQINPHFLNNTLEIINWEARIAGNQRVGDMIDALGTMLSAAMLRNGQTKATLMKELEVVDAYLHIISVRMGNGLIVDKQVDDSLLDAVVPCMIVQPVVENAVEHGIKPHQNGTLHLRIRREEEMMVIEVENDGTFSDEQRDNIDRLLAWNGHDVEIVRSAEVGIRNVNYRLKILYGAESGLDIHRTSHDTTIARMTLPIRFDTNWPSSVNKSQSV